MDSGDGSSSRRKADQVWTMGVLVLVLVLIGTTFCIWTFAELKSSGFTVSSACDDGNPCTGDFRHDLGFCENPNLAKDVACHDKCHNTGATTHCNGAGVCVASDPTKCKGYCASDDEFWTDCDSALFPMAAYFTDPYYDPDEIYSETMCFANQCVHVVVQASLYTSNALWETWTGMFVPCMMLLDHTQTDVDLSCIEAREVQLQGDNSIELFSTKNEDDEGYSGRACIFTFRCSRLNTTLLNDEELLSSVSLMNVTSRLHRKPPVPGDSETH